MSDTPTQIDDGGPVHPTQPLGIDGTPTHEQIPGMSIRDYFAGQALVGLLSGQYAGSSDCNLSEVPSEAYLIAATMIAERNKGGAS